MLKGVDVKSFLRPQLDLSDATHRHLDLLSETPSPSASIVVSRGAQKCRILIQIWNIWTLH